MTQFTLHCAAILIIFDASAYIYFLIIFDACVHIYFLIIFDASTYFKCFTLFKNIVIFNTIILDVFTTQSVLHFFRRHSENSYSRYYILQRYIHTLNVTSEHRIKLRFSYDCCCSILKLVNINYARSCL